MDIQDKVNMLLNKTNEMASTIKALETSVIRLEYEEKLMKKEIKELKMKVKKVPTAVVSSTIGPLAVNDALAKKIEWIERVIKFHGKEADKLQDNLQEMILLIVQGLGWVDDNGITKLGQQAGIGKLAEM